MIVAIIGSRNFKNMELINSILEKEFTDNYKVVITGGAPGVDKFAEQFCKEKIIPCKVIRPVSNEKIYYLFRNVEILRVATKVIAFWDGESKGTKFTIDYANERGIPITVYDENGNKNAFQEK